MSLRKGFANSEGLWMVPCLPDPDGQVVNNKTAVIHNLTTGSLDKFEKSLKFAHSHLDNCEKQPRSYPHHPQA
jgi:hypothetical protein